MEKSNCKKYSRRIWLNCIFASSFLVALGFAISAGSLNNDFILMFLIGFPFSIIFGIMLSTPLYIGFLIAVEFLFFRIKNENTLRLLVNLLAILFFLVPHLLIALMSFNRMFFVHISSILTIGIASASVWVLPIDRVELIQNKESSIGILDDIDFEN